MPVKLQRPIFAEEHRSFRDSFRKFLANEVLPHQEAWLKEGIVPRDIWLKCGTMGFLCPCAPEAYGGLAADFLYEVVIMEELAYAAETGLAVSLHNSLVAPYIYSYASEALKERLIPKMISGEAILAIAMTEPDAGSDLANIKTTATEDGDAYILSGAKTFISNGILSDAVVVAAKTDIKSPHGMGLFVVERGMAGFHRGRKLEKLGFASQDTAELVFENVRVPKENLLGAAGQGFAYMMEKLAIERLICAISNVAAAERALDETLKYVKERQAFGKPIGKFQNTKFKLAEAYTKTQAARIYVDRLIEEQRAGSLTGADACGAKYLTSDLNFAVADECLQLHGGYGYMMEYPISRLFADARVGRIFAGTNEIMKTVVAKSLGL